MFYTIYPKQGWLILHWHFSDHLVTRNLWFLVTSKLVCSTQISESKTLQYRAENRITGHNCFRNVLVLLNAKTQFLPRSFGSKHDWKLTIERWCQSINYVFSLLNHHLRTHARNLHLLNMYICTSFFNSRLTWLQEN